MALPIREESIESTRQIRVTEVRFGPNSDGSESADIDFDVKHNDEDRSVNQCWAIFNVTATEKQQLLDIKPDWKECKVHLKALSNYMGDVSICISLVQLGDAWIEPKPVSSMG